MFSWKGFLGGSQPQRDEPVILPESVRYALRYNEARLGKEEVLSMLERPKLGFASTYCGLKFLAPSNDALLRGIGLYAHASSENIPQDALNNELRKLVIEIEDHSVGAKKIAELSRYGLDVSRLYTRMMQEVVEKGYTQVILAYAGLAALPELITAGSTEWYVLIDDKKFHEDIRLIKGMKIANLWNIQLVPLSSLQGSVALIDDSKRTGETLESAVQTLMEANPSIDPKEYIAVKTGL